MPEKKQTVGSELRLLDRLLDEETRLVKKYLLDSKGQLKLYHPLTQAVLFRMMKGEQVNLLEELQKYHNEKKTEKEE